MKNSLFIGEFSKMEKIAEGFSDFGDFKAILFKTSDGRHFVRFLPFNTLEKPHSQWLPGDEYLEWLRCWGKCSAT
jgi:hypothetical protein